MSVNLSPLAGAGWQFLTNNAAPLSGGLLYTYAAGTTTPQATYTTNAGTIAHSNPIVLDSAGRIPTGEVWLTSSVSYKFVLYDSVSALIGSWDNITSESAATLFYNRGVANAVTRTIQSKLNDFVSALDFGVAASNTAGQNSTYLQNAINYAGSIGATLYIPAGHYVYNTPLILTGNPNNIVCSIELRGDAPNARYGSWDSLSQTPYGTVLEYTGSTYPAIKTGQGRDITIRNLVVYGTNKTVVGSIGIGVTGGNSGFNTYDIKVANFETGIKLGYDVDGNGDVNTMWNTEVNNCYTGIWFSKSQNYINNIYNAAISTRVCIRSDGPSYNVYGGIFSPEYVTVDTESVWSDTVAVVSGQDITLTSGAHLVVGQYMVVQGNNSISTAKFPFNSPLGVISVVAGAKATLDAASYAGGILVGAVVYYGYPSIIFQAAFGANIVGAQIESNVSPVDNKGYASIYTLMTALGTLSMSGVYINQALNSDILYNKLLPSIVHYGGTGDYAGNHFTAPQIKVQQQSDTPLYFKDTWWDSNPLIIGNTGYYPNGTVYRNNDRITGNYGDTENNLANLFITKPYYNPSNSTQVAPQTNSDLFYQTGSTPPTTAVTGQTIPVTGTNSTTFYGWKNTQTDVLNGIHTNVSISTTGAITSGSNVLTVASVANMQQFMTIKVSNAGAGSSELVTRIELIDGKNKKLYLSDNAGTSQGSASVVAVTPSWYQIGMVWKETNLSYGGGTIADKASATVTGTLTGAALSDYVIAASSIDLQGCSISANVTSTDNVKVTISNLTGGGITLAASTVRVRIVK